jgi:hypothetical protein
VIGPSVRHGGRQAGVSLKVGLSRRKAEHEASDHISRQTRFQNVAAVCRRVGIGGDIHVPGPFRPYMSRYSLSALNVCEKRAPPRKRCASAPPKKKFALRAATVYAFSDGFRRIFKLLSTTLSDIG